MRLAFDRALGLVETLGLVGAIEALDAMSKAADVRLRGPDRAGAGLYLIAVNGTVGAVRAAVEAGSRAASRVGSVVSVHIIPKPDEGIEGILPKPPETTPTPASGSGSGSPAPASPSRRAQRTASRSTSRRSAKSGAAKKKARTKKAAARKTTKKASRSKKTGRKR